MAKTKLKKQSVSKLKAKAWKLFSLMIRLRDSDQHGFSKCVTCNANRHYTEMQAGHFISRRHSATLFEPRNVHTQDAACNIWKNGEPTNYWLFMERPYGRVVIDELIALSKTSKRFTIPELEAMIEIFNSKIKDYVKKDSI